MFDECADGDPHLWRQRTCYRPDRMHDDVPYQTVGQDRSQSSVVLHHQDRLVCTFQHAFRNPPLVLAGLPRIYTVDNVYEYTSWAY